MENQYTAAWSSLKTKIESRLVESESGCWIWTGAKTGRGYGNVSWAGKSLRVHRAYLIEIGVSVPKGMDVDHLCRVHDCANPDHLEVVTHQENTRRGEVGTWKRADFCKHGHGFTSENTRVTKQGARSCRICHSISNAMKVPCRICGKNVSSGNRAAHERLHERRY